MVNPWKPAPLTRNLIAYFCPRVHFSSWRHCTAKRNRIVECIGVSQRTARVQRRVEMQRFKLQVRDNVYKRGRWSKRCPGDILRNFKRLILVFRMSCQVNAPQSVTPRDISEPCFPHNVCHWYKIPGINLGHEQKEDGTWLSAPLQMGGNQLFSKRAVTFVQHRISVILLLICS